MVSESKHPAWSSVLLVTHRSRNPSASARCATRRTSSTSIGSGERCGSDTPSEILSFSAINSSPCWLPKCVHDLDGDQEAKTSPSKSERSEDSRRPQVEIWSSAQKAF